MILIINNKDSLPAVELILYPRSDCHLRFTDFKLELGACGIEQLASLEVFRVRDGTWVTDRWDTPRPVGYAGQILHARYSGVKNVSGFDILSL